MNSDSGDITQLRSDYRVIAGVIEENSKVLDLGCGSGDLMKYLQDTRSARVQGIELDGQAVHQCVEKGLSVFQSDIDSGLTGYPDGTFDYIILNQSLQEVRNIGLVLSEAFRVGKKVIVGFPNFAYIDSRLMLFFRGRVPITRNLPYEWYDTPNLRFLSVGDFERFCERKNLRVVSRAYLGCGLLAKLLPNLFAQTAVFVIAGNRPGKN